MLQVIVIMKKELSVQTIDMIKDSATLITAHNEKITFKMNEILYRKYPHRINQCTKLAEALPTYALNIARWAKKTGKEIAFVYDGSQEIEDSFEYTKFIFPSNFGKLKTIVPYAINEIFSKDTIKPYCIKNLTKKQY